MTFYNRLQLETTRERNKLLNMPLIVMGLNGEISKEDYISFLTEAYHHVKHTVPLLMSSGSQLTDSYEWLQNAITEYIREETGHQEWILNDIEACGVDRETVRSGKPTMATELMVAYIYDYIQRKNPVGIFGMVLVLEGTSISLAINAADAIQKALGLPDQAFSYLRSHGKLDIEHFAFFEKLMNQITSVEDQDAIVHAAKVIYMLYANIFYSLKTGRLNQIAA